MSYIAKVKRFWLPSLTLLLSQSTLVKAGDNDEFVLEPYQVAERMAQHQRQGELNQELRTPLLAKPHAQGIEVTSFENYDEFIVNVTNQSGFKKQIISATGNIDIYSLELPVDGEYQFDVLAVKHTNEVIRDVMNNGRDIEAKTTMTVTQKVTGRFTILSGDMVVPEVLLEPKPGSLPNKGKPELVKHSLLGGE